MKLDSPFPHLELLCRSLSFMLVWRAARGTGESDPICYQIFPSRASWSIWTSTHVRCFMDGENKSPERAVICGVIKEQCLYLIRCRESKTGKHSNWRQSWCGCWTLDNSIEGKNPTDHAQCAWSYLSLPLSHTICCITNALLSVF